MYEIRKFIEHLQEENRFNTNRIGYIKAGMETTAETTFINGEYVRTPISSEIIISNIKKQIKINADNIISAMRSEKMI